MSSSESEMVVYECQACDDRQVAFAELNCCGEPMEAVDATIPIESPDVERVMYDIFDISTELDVCRQVLAEEEATIDELTDTIDRNRSVITRHLNHLVELRIVEKHSRVLMEGGRVNVYSHRPEEAVRRQLELGLYMWLIDALDVIDDVSEEKIAMMAQSQTETDSDGGL